MEGVLFSSYARDEPSCQIQRKPYWEIECDKYIRQVLEKSNIDTREFQFTCDRYHCHLQTKFKGGSTIQLYEKRLTDVWSQYGDKYG